MPPHGFTAAHSTSNGISSDSADLVVQPLTGNSGANDNPGNGGADDNPSNDGANDKASNDGTDGTDGNQANILPAIEAQAQPRSYYEHLAFRYRNYTNVRMDAPKEGPVDHQFDEFVMILHQQRTKEIAMYQDTNNQHMLELDWTTSDGGFNRACMYGDWVHGPKVNNIGRRPRLPPCNMIRNFIEIQIKRVDGSDDAGLEACGVNADYAFLGLIDQSDRTSDTSGSSQSTVTAITAAGPGAWPTEHVTATTAGESSMPAMGTTTGESSKFATTTTTGDSSKSAAATKEEVQSPLHPAPSGPGAWPAERTARSLSPIVNVNTCCSTSSDTSSETSSETYSIHADDGASMAAEDAYLAAVDAAEARFEKLLAANPAFAALKSAAAVYLVRVVGIANPPLWATKHTNANLGPRERRGTLLGLGGWVVPQAEKFKRPEAGKKVCGRMEARDVQGDWTFDAPECVEGEYLPVWKGEREPGLEDVYSMVWDLVMRRKFVGLVTGYGFGCREEIEGFPFRGLREINPFKTQGRHGEE